MATLAQFDLSQDDVLLGMPMPLTITPPAGLSDDEIIAFSQRVKPFRVERNAAGELEIMAPVGMDGGQREFSVSGELYLWVSKHGGVAFIPDTGFRLPDGSVRSPDASWLSQSRYQALNREERRRFGHICPQFLIEILSETDSRPALEAKMTMWIANGAELAWMIDPYARTVSIYRPDAPVQVLQQPDVVEAGEPVPGFRLLMQELWDR